MRQATYAAALVALVGCSKGPEKGPGDAAGPAALAAPAGQLPADVAARVNGAPVPLAALEAEIARLPAAHRQFASTPQAKRQFLDMLVEQRLLAQEADRRGIPGKPEVAERIEAYRKQVYRDALLDELAKDVPAITDEDVRKYFDTHAEEFKIPERLVAEVMTAGSEENAKAALARLKKGDAFAAVAKELATDPQPGVQEFTRDQRPELWPALVLAKPGQHAGPVKVATGYTVARMVRLKGAEAKTFEENKEALKLRLQALRRQEAYTDLLKKLKSSASVEVNPSALAERKP